MGNERPKRRKYLFLYGACLILFLISGCATGLFQEKRQGKKRLYLAAKLDREGDYEGALKLYDRILRRHPKTSPGDRVLYRMGLIRMNPDNAQRDYGKARERFQRLVADFPRSSLRREAEVWLGIIEELIGCKAEIRNLKGVVATLKERLNALKEIDIGIEEKKREDLPRN